MWVSGGRAFLTEGTASAKALGQECACLRQVWPGLERGRRRGQVCLGHNEDLDSCARCAGGGQRGAEEGGEGT